ncbi:MAG: MFS transporter [Gaiellaceae bacterium MAG52_C11]|nr:MFS transporter [Candidatus Gaiellasilicea maunaloa]
MPALSHRLGALRERDFRLLFTATTITTLGDHVASIALVFAVLRFGSATDLGLVLGARSLAEAAIMLFGGVLADRLPRSHVLVAASLVQGVAQTATAVAILGGTGSVALVIALQIVYGLGAGVVLPAEVGLVPQTVSAARLQQANALQGLTRSGVRVLGPALGGALVVVGSPGIALAVDGVSFFVCAAILGRIRIPRREALPASFLTELRDGWREFSTRTWLWASVVLFGVGNLAFSSWAVLGPVIAEEDLGGAGAWAIVLTVGGIGSLAGALLAIRVRPARPLVVCTLAAVPLAGQLVALALGAPLWVLAASSFVAAVGIGVHLTLWFTIFQQQVPEHAQSRVSSYDTLGSFVLIPLGLALVGPIAAAIGRQETLWLSLAIMLASWAAILALPSVWAIRRTEVQPEAGPPPTLSTMGA